VRGIGRRLRTFLIVFAALAAIRLALPWGVRAYVNRVIDRVPEFQGTIAGLDLNLWRGAYEIEGIRLEKLSGGVAQPFFEAKRIDLSIQWGALLSGALVGEVAIERPIVSFVQAESEERSQTGVDRSWQERFAELLPLRINRFTVRDAEVRLQILHSEPTVDLFIDDLHIVATNLTNVHEQGSPFVARVEAAGRPFGLGQLEASLLLDPTTRPLRFDLEAALRGVPMIELNDLFVAFGNFDVERGRLDVYAEFAAAQGRVEGYVKPVLEDVRVLRFGEIDSPLDALEALWESLIEVASEVLERRPGEVLATKVPMDVTLGEVDTDVWSAIGGLLRNAFVRGVLPVIDDTIDVDSIQKVAAEEAEAADGESKP
jgi:hypothetical protein